MKDAAFMVIKILKIAERTLFTITLVILRSHHTNIETFTKKTLKLIDVSLTLWRRDNTFIIILWPYYI